MQWECLTGPEFARAVKKVKGVCVMAAGCVEQHGPHLPLGTDFLNGHKICTLAAEQEPALVFPPYYFGQIHEARHCPGTIAIDPILTMQILMNVCDEIYRNGCRKIVIYNAHGGNHHLLRYFAQSLLAQRKPYAVYCVGDLSEERKKRYAALLETPLHAHACECETSIALANDPDSVKMKALRNRTANSLNRLAGLPNGFTGIGWYSKFPEHYAGDARSASAAKGRQLRALIVDNLVEYIRAVKRDRVTLRLQDEFYTRAERIGGMPPA